MHSRKKKKKIHILANVADQYEREFVDLKINAVELNGANESIPNLAYEKETKKNMYAPNE